MARPVYRKWRLVHCVLGGAVALVVAGQASAALITYSLGNTSSGFVDGAVVSASDVGTAQAGQPAPFNTGSGSDLFANASFTFTFTYSPIADPLVSAFLDFGIVDADGASTGDQVALFQVAGITLTTEANTAFNAGGASGVYDIFTFELNSLLANLVSGSVTVLLNLQGPVQSPVLFPPPEFVDDPYNGANLIFASLRLTTRDGNGNGGGTDVPEPGTLALLCSGLIGLIYARRRRRDVVAY